VSRGAGAWPRGGAGRPGSVTVTTHAADETTLRAAVRDVCAGYPAEYWRGLEPDRYPDGFVKAMTEAGLLAVLIPTEYGGSGLGLEQAAVILEEVNAAGGNASACHAQMYTMGTLLRHGREEQKRRWLPQLASGAVRLQAFGVTEREAGSETTQIETHAERRGGGWVINGHKAWTSRALHSDLMLLLARTAPYDDSRRADGLSVFLVDLRDLDGVTIRPTAAMVNHSTSEVFFADVQVPGDTLVGEEGKGFRHILDGMNAERILIAAECVGDGRWFVETGCRYASERVVFGRPIGANQGVQFPLARAYAAVRAADLMRREAARRFDAGEPAGAEANMAKLLASEASWQAANACLDAHGGYGFLRDFDVERKFRETRVYQTAPVNNNLVLAYLGQNVLGMPRSY
jgi:acyl-CoA dehydrogenase